MLKLEYNYNHYKWPTLLLCDTNYWWGDAFLCQSGYVHESLLNKSKFGLPRISSFIAVCLSLPHPTNGIISYSDPTLGVGKPFQTAKYISPESHHRWLHLLKGLYSVPVNNDWYLVKHLRMSQNQQKIWPFAIELLHSGKDVMLLLFTTNLRANVHQQFWSFCRKAISIYPFLYPPTVLIAYSP